VPVVGRGGSWSILRARRTHETLSRGPSTSLLDVVAGGSTFCNTLRIAPSASEPHITPSSGGPMSHLFCCSL
jgi:hypothetical protein